LSAAVRQYAHAASLQPSDVGFLMLARALRNEGHDDEAQAMFQRAVKLSPNLTQAEKQADALLAGDTGSISMTIDQ
jgi:Flp pilus assembly protein TadD